MSKELVGFVKGWEATVRKSQAAIKRRSNSIFCAMMSAAVAHADDDDPSCTGSVRHVEKVLPNGDFYTGQWFENLPNGQGKYLWTDGCMYVGEWYKGKTMGKGKFSWPSGATYEGDFKSGYMDGKGTYTGSSGVTYRGSWVMNLRHGHGIKSYATGDYYEGEWRRGLQDGHGRYQWKNGNHYIGQWRNGMMNGNGTMIWSNGNRYDGFWEDGLPKGNGTFRWADGSFYVGVWSKDPKEQNGTYYPSGSHSGNLDWDPREVFLEDLNDCQISVCEKVTIYPSQKVLNMPGIDQGGSVKSIKGNGDDGRPRRMSVDGRLSNYSVASMESNEAFGGAGGDGEWKDGDEGYGHFDDLDSRMHKLNLQPAKKQGETISKGHKNYELMLNLQLGIRYLRLVIASYCSVFVSIDSYLFDKMLNCSEIESILILSCSVRY